MLAVLGSMKLRMTGKGTTQDVLARIVRLEHVIERERARDRGN